MQFVVIGGQRYVWSHVLRLRREQRKARRREKKTKRKVKKPCAQCEVSRS